MKHFSIWLCLVPLIGSVETAPAETRFHFVMDETQVVPPSGSVATARAVATLNDAETELTFIIEHDVVSPVEAALYAGARGTNGTLSFTFASAESAIVETWALSPADVTDLLADNLYVQISSAGFPAGDIRGQIAPNPDPQPGDVIITEIMYNPASMEDTVGSAPEWIELFNTTYTDINIGGWFFQDEDREAANPCTLMRSGTIPGLLLPSFEVVVIIPNGNTSFPTVADFKTAWGLGADADVLQLNGDGTSDGAIVGRNLSNSPYSDNNDANDLPLLIEPCDPQNPTSHPENEVLTLNDGSQIIDLVNYDDSAPWPTDNNQSSIALVPADYPANTDFSTYDVVANNSGANWILHTNGDDAGGRLQDVAAGVYEGNDVGSPGFLVGATTGNQPPTAGSQTLPIQPGATVDITLIGNDATRPFFGLLLFVIRSIPQNGQLIDLGSGHVITGGDVTGNGYLMGTAPFNQLRYVNDGTCGRTEFTFNAYDGILYSPLATVDLIVQCGEIAITEIMYDPDSSETPPPSLPEWVELYNTTDSPVDLAGWYLEDDEGRCGDLPSYILGARSAVAMIPSAGSASEFGQGWSAPVVQPTVNSETSDGALTGQNLANFGDELRLVEPGGPLQLVSDAVYYLDGQNGWPETFFDGPSIYVQPPASGYNAYDNDDPTVWGLSAVGIDGAYQVSPTTIYNGSDVGSPGVLQDVLSGDCSASGAPDDGNGDGLVDQKDFEHFELCFSGPGGTPPLNCDCLDTDADGDVDCTDWTTFGVNWTGPPAEPPASALCPASCCGDFDGSNYVNLADFVVFAGCFGLSEPTPACPAADLQCADLNGDQVVDLADFVLFASFFDTVPSCN